MAEHTEQQQQLPQEQEQQVEQQQKQQPELPQQQRTSDQPPAEQQQGGQQQLPPPLQRLGNCKIVHSSKDKCIWECADFCGRPCIIKQTTQASAKHPLLDRKMAKKPCQQDVAGMCRARKAGVHTPKPYHISCQHGLVFCEKVEGATLQQRLSEAQELDADVVTLMSELGRVLAVLHNGGVVHGALCCSCILVRDSDQALVLCDFELSTNSMMPRDKASDLVLLEADLQQTGPHLTGLFDKVVAAYNKHCKQWSAVFNRLPEARNALQKHQKGQQSKKQRIK